jgi:hypothetical protein
VVNLLIASLCIVLNSRKFMNNAKISYAIQYALNKLMILLDRYYLLYTSMDRWKIGNKPSVLP